MSKILVFSSSDRSVDDREMSITINSSDSESNGNSGSTNELFSSRTLRIPLEVFQEEMRRKAAFGSSASSSTAP